MFIERCATLLCKLTSPATVFGIAIVALGASGAATVMAMSSAPVGQFGNSTPQTLPAQP